MPAIAEKRKVLDGRAEVVSYRRDPEKFVLRIYEGKQSYKSLRIEGAFDLDTACDKALDVFLSYQRSPAETASRSKTESKPRQKKGVIVDWVNKYLADQQEQQDAGLLKPGTVKNKRETLTNHLIPYCINNNIKSSLDIKVGSFDRYPLYRAGISRHTLRRELAAIKMFVNYLHRHKLMNPYEMTKDLFPSVRLKDEDWDSNPPIRDDGNEWQTILKHLHQYVEDGKRDGRAKVRISRLRFWNLILLLRHSGLRPQEAMDLRWCDIETENIGRISQTKKEAEIQMLEHEGIMLTELNKKQLASLGEVDRFIIHIRVLASKTGALREVTCNAAQAVARWKQTVRQYLHQYQSHFLYNNVELKIDPDDGLPIIPNDALVFAIPEKNEWSAGDYSTISYQWRELMKRCKDDLAGPILSPHPYTIYSLRATKAQELMNLGVDIYVAAKLMGHTPDILYKIYQRLPQRKRAIAEAIPIEYGKPIKKDRMVKLEDVYTKHQDV